MMLTDGAEMENGLSNRIQFSVIKDIDIVLLT